MVTSCDNPVSNETPNIEELTGTVAIEGTATVGQTLTANTDNLGGTGAISYQWLRGNTDIPGATGASYVLTADDQGSTISVRVTRAGNTGRVTSGSTGAVTADDRPALSGTVTVDGTATVGQTLTANITDLEGSGTISYQWLRGNTDIPEATGVSYTVAEADVGSAISVRVTRADNSGSITGGPTTAVTSDERPALTGTVTIEGTATVGQTLTAITDNLGGTGAVSYQWIRGNTDIPGATGVSYVLTADDQGSTISVRVTRADTSGTVTSDPTGAVTADDRPTLSGIVTIEGTPTVGQTLTVNTTALEGSGDISYQWIRGGTDIPEATGASYVLTADDEGSTISVRVTRAGNTGTVTSDPTAAVTVPAPDTGTINITIGFNYGVITIAGSNGANVIYKTSADPKSLTLSAAGYDDVKWYIDGDNTSAETGDSITLNANNYSAKPHSITFTGKKDGKLYAQVITFTVRN
ncbi:MAG: hypothetical protein LBL76_03765 [Treponema sp.]|jgi:hypothetical protein|nr:hypothetical protein [Treponema sp.]